MKVEYVRVDPAGLSLRANAARPPDLQLGHPCPLISVSNAPDVTGKVPSPVYPSTYMSPELSTAMPYPAPSWPPVPLMYVEYSRQPPDELIFTTKAEPLAPL